MQQVNCYQLHWPGCHGWMADGKVSVIGKSPFYPHRDKEALTSVVDPKLLFSDPDPALGLISEPDPDSDPDPACLTKVIRPYLICPQESIAQRFSSHFRR